MVQLSPMVFGNIEIKFVKHDQGSNWRAIDFNDDVWMLMMGFPDDYKTERHIHNAINDFGRVVLWEESEHFPGRVMVRARVTSVHEVPQFLLYTDPTNPTGQSWTIQCEVMQRAPNAVEPPQEEYVPEDIDEL